MAGRSPETKMISVKGEATARRLVPSSTGGDSSLSYRKNEDVLPRQKLDRALKLETERFEF